MSTLDALDGGDPMPDPVETGRAPGDAPQHAAAPRVLLAGSRRVLRSNVERRDDGVLLYSDLLTAVACRHAHAGVPVVTVQRFSSTGSMGSVVLTADDLAALQELLGMVAPVGADAPALGRSDEGA